MAMPGRPANPRLAPYVRSVHAYDVAHPAGPGVHIGMPSPHLTFVLPLDDRLDVSWAGRPDTRTSTWASVSGLHTEPAAIHHGGRQRGVQLSLTPAGARALWGVPAGELAGGLLDLADVDPGLADLPERLAGARSWPGRLAVVEEALCRALDRHDALATRAEVGRALTLLVRGAGVAETADEVGYSRRRLSTLVRHEVGVTPRELQRLGRFAVAHGLLRRAALRGTPSVARVAADAGYADQAHLAREWSRLAGCSPTEWLRREFPIVQAVAASTSTG
jgi:AraC-like DNA-binding protein